MNQKKMLVIGILLLVLMSTIVQAGFLAWIKSVFTGPSLTGFAARGGECDKDNPCASPDDVCTQGVCKEIVCLSSDVLIQGLEDIKRQLEELKGTPPDYGLE